jgi:hypothetical protein
MAVQLLKDIKVQCVHPDKYFPENIQKGEWYDVIGVNSHNYFKEKEGKKTTETSIKFLLVNDIMKITSVAMHNCLVVDKEKEIKKSPKKKK